MENIEKDNMPNKDVKSDHDMTPDRGMWIRPIARIQSDLKEKFGIPRQSGLVPELLARVVFEPAFADPAAVRGLEGFSHIWLIWEFSEAKRESFSPTVRPPRLGGNERMGVFATRSPFRPNALGLSCVELKGIETGPGKTLSLLVAGADLLDGTPVYDIKPYIPFADSRPEATGGFVDAQAWEKLEVDFPEPLLCRLPADKREAAKALLAEDPRPAYHDDPGREYGLIFAGFNIRFRVEDGRAKVTAVEA